MGLCVQRARVVRPDCAGLDGERRPQKRRTLRALSDMRERDIQFFRRRSRPRCARVPTCECRRPGYPAPAERPLRAPPRRRALRRTRLPPGGGPPPSPPRAPMSPQWAHGHEQKYFSQGKGSPKTIPFSDPSPLLPSPSLREEALWQSLKKARASPLKLTTVVRTGNLVTIQCALSGENSASENASALSPKIGWHFVIE